MSPYEIVHLGGSVEHHNDEAGSVWLQRLAGHWGGGVSQFDAVRTLGLDALDPAGPRYFR